MATSRLTLPLLLVLAGCNQAAFPEAPVVGSEMTPAIVDPYLKIQSALANDSVDELRANAGTIATAATALGAPAMNIDTTALRLASAVDLDDARTKFGALSEAIDIYMTGLKLNPPEGVRVAFCPMARRPWLQQTGSLRNPYYGSQMLTCGSFKN